MSPARVSIIGVGTTRHVSHYPRLNWLEMLNLAVKDALEDAGGLNPAEIEAGVVAYHGEVMTEMGNIGRVHPGVCCLLRRRRGPSAGLDHGGFETGSACVGVRIRKRRRYVRCFQLYRCHRFEFGP